jgi:outer membrane usher protein
VGVARPAWGGLVNCAVHGLVGQGAGARLSAYGEARLFGPPGVLSTSVLSSPEARGGRVRRLDSSLVAYGRPGQRWLAGDFVSSGLAWARSVRAGGVSLVSNFDLRPDLVTQPIPVVTGAAATPSTVDLYVDGVRRYSGEVAAGPFTLREAPLPDGQGQVRVVVTDVLGQSTVQTLPFYASRQLLRPGLASYAVEAGFVRLGYGGPRDR